MNIRLPLGAAALLASALAGCAAEDPSAASTAARAAAVQQAAATAPGELPAGWRRLRGAAPPAPATGQPRLPVTVRSDDGVDVVVEDAARIVAGGDDIIDVLEALGQGGRVYAAPTNTTTAAGRAAAHRFLFNRTTGAEGVLSLDGSLFIGNSLRRHGELARTLRALGQDAVVIDDLQPAPEKIRKVAAALGMDAAGGQLANAVRRQLDAAAARGGARPYRPRVIHVSATGAGGSPTVAGVDSASGQLIALAGGVNIGSEAGVANFSALSNEGVVAAAPEVILVTEQDLQRFGGPDGLWTAYPTLRQTPAGQAGRVWVMPDMQLKYTGVGSGAGALALAGALAGLPGQ